MNIVLLEPEIPYNAGAIGRTCLATGASLHLIRPLGFDISERAVRRAGLDYWKFVDVHDYNNYESFLDENAGKGSMFFATTKAQKTYTDVTYEKNSYIIFGKESAGLPEELLVQNRENCIRIPMLDEMRSLNLSVSAGIILYEALRQNSFSGLTETGNLHRLKWS